MAGWAQPLRSDAFASVARILDAARRVFTNGDGSETLNQIAKEAGVGVATLYRHFPNRQTLAGAVYEQVFTEEVEPLLLRLRDSGTDRAALLDIGEHLADLVRRERVLVRSMDNFTGATTRLLQRSSDLLEPVLRRCQDAGTIRPDLRPADLPNILAMIAAALGTLDTDPATRRRYLNLILDGLSPQAMT